MTRSHIHILFLLLAGVAALCAFNGCASHHLLTTAPPAASATPGGNENRTLLFERTYRFTSSGALTMQTHTIVRVGSHGTEELLSVYDGSIEKLAAFEARMIHADGSLEWYDRGDLGNYSLSSGRVIEEASLRFVFVKKVPQAGDLIEMAYEHELTLPQLGTLFTLRECGHSPSKVTLTYEVPAPDTLYYVVLNDSLSPVVSRKGEITEYRFAWASPARSGRRSVFAKSNDEPGVIAVNPARGPSSWKEFGDWYLGVIQDRFRPDERIAEQAKRITMTANTDLEKMNALAAYCQRSVRYEQVYLACGEFIPNPAPVILAKKFGDCKDYSCLLISMARSLGIDVHPALCYRGRGFSVCEALPVTQFNHMIAHFRSGETDHWYDGTNQTGIPGITTDDLVNARALIIEQGNSRMETIPESGENLFSVAGTLREQGTSLSGDLTVHLAGQYAVIFQYIEKYGNEGAVRSWLVEWLRRQLAGRMNVSRLMWKSSAGGFELAVSCEFPNALLKIEGKTYAQFDRIFDRLLPEEEPGEFRGNAYEFPGYARADVELDLPEFQLPGKSEPFHWSLRYALPAGPFAPSLVPDFRERLQNVRLKMHQSYTLSK